MAKELRALGVKGILLIAAEKDRITEKKCAMDHCFSPGGRDWFVPIRPLGVPRSPWEPTHEHAPLAKRRGGVREIGNVLLAHKRCNNVGYKLEALKEHLESIRLSDGSPLDAVAIEFAIEENVAERATHLGRYPRKRGSWKTARAVAQKAHEELRPKFPS